MSIMELGALGEFLGVFALVATLIYLAIQVRQSKQAMAENSILVRQAGLDQTFGQFSRHRDRIINNAEVAKIWIDGMAGNELGEIDGQRFDSMAVEYILINRGAYLRSRVVEDEILRRTSTRGFARGLHRNRGMRRIWEESLTSAPSFDASILRDAVPNWAEEVERFRAELEKSETQQ